MKATEKSEPRMSIQNGEWVVDLEEGGKFGDTIQHGLDNSVIYMVLPKLSGWRPMDKGMMHSHQTYAKHIDKYLEENSTPRKIAVVNLDSGEWETVWETHEKWRLEDSD